VSAYYAAAKHRVEKALVIADQQERAFSRDVFSAVTSPLKKQHTEKFT
jgi:hypothetical protein